MTIVYSRIQATEANYRDKISRELDEDNKGIEFDFNSDDDNIINVEYSGKLIALVEKQEGDYIIERVAGTPQVSEVTQETEHVEGVDIDIDTQKTHAGTGGDVIHLTPQRDNIIRVNFG